MRNLGLGFASAALMAAAGVLLFLAGGAQAAPDPKGQPIEMELSGLAVPTTWHAPVTVADQPLAALSPSCDLNVPGACDWLQAVCGDLGGTMSETTDGTLTCALALD